MEASQETGNIGYVWGGNVVEKELLSTVHLSLCFKSLKMGYKKLNLGDFPGSPVVKTSASNAGGAGSIPGRRAKILHAS